MSGDKTSPVTHLNRGRARFWRAGAAFRAIALVDEVNSTPFFNSAVTEVGFESVTSGGTGVYCIVPSAGIDADADPPFITIDYGTSSGENFTAMWDQDTGNCADGTYEIQIYKADTNALTNDAGFVIMVP